MATSVSLADSLTHYAVLITIGYNDVHFQKLLKNTMLRTIGLRSQSEDYQKC